MMRISTHLECSIFNLGANVVPTIFEKSKHQSEQIVTSTPDEIDLNSNTEGQYNSCDGTSDVASNTESCFDCKLLKSEMNTLKVEYEAQIMALKLEKEKLTHKLAEKSDNFVLLRKELNQRKYEIKQLNASIVELQTNRYISPDLGGVVNTVELEDFIDCLCNGRKGKEPYSDHVRAICMNINFLSPRTYAYLREKFNKHLPHQSTIQAWYHNSNIDGSPGICKNSLDLLKEKAAKMRDRGIQLVGGIIFDEMRIRQNVQWCSKSRMFLGYATYGAKSKEYEQNDEPLIAKQVIVLMFTAINEFFQLPVAYHFIDTLDYQDRGALLLEVIKEITKCDVRIASVTFDGYSSNQTMCELLGGVLRGDSDQICPTFKNPANGDELHTFLDPSHSEKLVRNTLADLEVLYDGMGKKIEWKYFAQLVEFSVKMETISKSVADSMEFLMQNKVPEFTHAGPTIKFIRMFDKLWDIMNTSRIREGSLFKSALNPTNQNEVFVFLEEAKEYILSLKKRGKNSHRLTPLWKSKSKTGFLGYVMNIIGLKNIYNEFVVEKHWMPFVATYRVSQDHLEMFFGATRSMNGHNDNPTVQQFSSAYKKLLHQSDIRLSGCSNISLGCASNILSVSSRRGKLHDDLSGDVPVQNVSDGETNNDYLYELDGLERIGRCNHITDNMHDAGISFVAQSIENRMLNLEKGNKFSCFHCRLVLETNERLDTSTCISERTKFPCKSTFQLCKLTDNAIKSMSGFKTESTFKQKVYIDVLSNIRLSQLYPIYYEEDEHDLEHKNFLIKHIIDEYTRIKCNYLAKMQTMGMQNDFLRHHYLTRSQERSARIAGFNQKVKVVILRNTNMDRLLISKKSNRIQRTKSVGNLVDDDVQNLNFPNQQMVPLRSILKQPKNAPFSLTRRKSMPALKVSFRLRNDSSTTIDTMSPTNTRSPIPSTSSMDNRSTPLMLQMPAIPSTSSMSNASPPIPSTGSMGNTSTPLMSQVPAILSISSMANVSLIENASPISTTSTPRRSSAIEILLRHVGDMNREGRTSYIQTTLNNSANFGSLHYDDSDSD
ncbi:uncharacterized protein LOC116351424 [Contarinia nasturtii]|uniref:uncharacterized protein LOC116351424 n=1 Tax=Contarinia nasturtii TaxID=265458 RepID=UPI0012D3AF1F|nr:uncharacterized protein LOC116351424 [Contarinia nasturtii]